MESKSRLPPSQAIRSQDRFLQIIFISSQTRQTHHLAALLNLPLFWALQFISAKHPSSKQSTCQRIGAPSEIGEIQDSGWGLASETWKGGAKRNILINSNHRMERLHLNADAPKESHSKLLPMNEDTREFLSLNSDLGKLSLG